MRKHTTLPLLLAAMLASATTYAAEGVKVKVLLTVIEQREVPAREAGELAGLLVREGQLVKENEVVGRVDDKDVQLAAKRAGFERDIAAKEADNDVKVRAAKKSREVATAELRRAEESVQKYRKSISDTEMDRLRLVAQRAVLEEEQARHDLDKAKLTKKLKENDVAIAQRAIQRRQVHSPIDGMVVQIHRRRGEWVEPGQMVLRVLRINRLRAEGLVAASQVRGNVTGRRVTFSVDLSGSGQTQFTGKVVFVSPEVNPVNGTVRIWAEIENPRLLLRPGLGGSMVIDPK